MSKVTRREMVGFSAHLPHTSGISCANSQPRGQRCEALRRCPARSWTWPRSGAMAVTF